MPKNEKNTCIARERTVYNPAIQKAGENAGGMSTGAVPMTFHVEKRTFRADCHARRGKYATLNNKSEKLPGGAPGPVGETPTGYHSARGR